LFLITQPPFYKRFKNFSKKISLQNNLKRTAFITPEFLRGPFIRGPQMENKSALYIPPYFERNGKGILKE